ncbi:RHS repeat-associated core domain-containing protein [Lentisphaerota bacterium WC36G]|nr:RHS repeat-associated core domain-containing protein [Lentisphaerae bacterium WC36]
MALEKDGVAFNYIADGNKNITQLINLTTGEIANKYDYSPFGQLAKTDENVENVFKFSSEYAEKETGLIYYNYRYYNPKDGKWLSRDPIEEKGGFNLYGFVNNRINQYVDSLGLSKAIEATTEVDSVDDLWRGGNKNGYNGTNNRNLAESEDKMRKSCNKACGKAGANPKKVGNGKEIEIWTLLKKGNGQRRLAVRKEGKLWTYIIYQYVQKFKYARYLLQTYSSERWNCNCCEKGFLGMNNYYFNVLKEKLYETTELLIYITKQYEIKSLRNRNFDWDKFKGEVIEAGTKVISQKFN